MSPLDAIMESPTVYRLWQAPFAEDKFAPILAHNDLSQARAVLDVGCGPGTNAHHFSGADYLGIDINERFIQVAQRRYGPHFLVADAREFAAAESRRFDFILVNSFLHHIDTASTQSLLLHLSGLLTQDGHVHILDLVLPEQASAARLLARLDRGKFPRPLEVWRQIFGEVFEPVIFEPYDLSACGVALWKMVYFKGRAKT